MLRRVLRVKNEAREDAKVGATDPPGTTIDGDGLTTVPSDTLGLHILSEPENGNATVDIVAVHGLGGNSFSTWTHSNGTLWLKDLLPTEIKDARIMTYGYDVGMITKARTERSFTFAEGLLTELRDLRSGQARTRPLFFIAHSLGGIVVKKVLIIAKNRPTQYGDIIDSTRHLMFFGTPHQGTTSMVGFLRGLGASLSSPGSVLRELELWSPEVKETNSFFMTEIAPMFTITTFWEREKIAGVQVVDEGSARLHQTHEDVIGLDADHRSICKFKDAHDNKFIKSVRRLRAEISNLQGQPLNETDERMKDLLKNNNYIPRLKSLNTAQFQVEAERWINQEYNAGLKREFRDWINPPSFDDNDFLKHRSKLSNRHEKTAQWIFEQTAFKSWISGESRLLWVCGRPGCGKSVLASNVVHHLRAGLLSQSTLAPTVIHAFSDKQDEGKKSSASLLRTLLWQLVSSDQLSISQKLEIINDCRRTSRAEGSQQNSVDNRFPYMSSLFEKYIQMLPVVILLDGLDECYDPELLTSLLVQPGSLQSTGVRIWVSSQKVHTISRHLDRCFAKIDMEDQNIRALTDADIRQYVTAEFSTMDSSVMLENIEEMTDILTSKANGMFLWVAVAIPEVQAKVETTSDSVDQLRESIGNLPENMEKAFVHLLNRIMRPIANVGAHINEQRRTKLLQILRWSFHAVRPLTISELTEATTIVLSGTMEAQSQNFSHSLNTPALIRTLYPIVYLSDETVHIMHATFRGFFLPTGNMEPMVAVTDLLGSRNFQSEIASQCIVYLSQVCFKDFISLSSDSAQMDKFALFQYATMNWVNHLTNDPHLNVELQIRLKSFLSTNQAITWLEKYLENDVDGIEMLQSQLYMHQGYVTDPQWILKLLIDGVEERVERDPNSVKTELMINALGVLYRYHGMTKNAVTVLEKNYRKQKALVVPDARRLRIATNNLALAKSDLDQWNEAKKLFEELLETAQALGDDGVDDAAIAMSNLGTVWGRLGNVSKCVEISTQLLTQMRALHGDHHVKTCLAYNNLGHAYLSAGRAVLGREYAVRAVQLYTDVQGKDSHGTLVALINLATAESAMGNDAEALRLTEGIWRKRRDMLGDAHPDTLLACNNYATCLIRLERVTEATELFEKQVRTFQKVRGPTDRGTLTARGNFANALERVGRLGEALELERHTLATRKQVFGTTHPETLLSMHNYAMMLREDSKFQEAIPLLVDCHRLYSQQLGQYHQSTVKALSSLSEICEEQDLFHLSEHLAIRARQLTVVIRAEDHQSTLLSDITCAVPMVTLGKFDAAEVLMKRILRRARMASIEDPNIILTAKAVLSRIHRLRGDYDAALDVADQIVEQSEHRGAEGQDMKKWLLAGWEHRGLALRELDRHQEALVMLQKVHVERVKTFGLERLTTLLTQCNLALCHQEIGEIEVADRYIEHVLETWMDRQGKGMTWTAWAMTIKAKCLSSLGKHAEAKSLQLEAIEVRQTRLGPRHLLTLRATYDLAKIQFQSGDITSAQQTIQAVLRDQQRYLPEDHPHTIQSAVYLDKVHALLGADHVSRSTIAPEEGHDVGEHTAELQALQQTLEEAMNVFGSDDPEIYRIQRELALARQAVDGQSDAVGLLQEVLEKQTEILSAAHPETITTLVEVIRLSGDGGGGDKQQLAQAVFDMIRASSTRDLNLFRKILELKPDMTALDPESGYTPLAFAVHRNELELVRCLLESGVDSNTVETDGKTCLYISVAAQQLDTVRLLLHHKANPHLLAIVDKEQLSPLYLASAKGNIDIARILMVEGLADPNSPQDVPPLIAAAGFDRPNLVELLLQHGADIEVLYSNGLTPFLNGISSGHLRTVELLYKRGANTNARTRSDATPLHLACFKGFKQIVAFLISIGKDVNEIGVGSFTPLHTAAEQGFWDIAEALISAGASLDSQTTNSLAWTPLISAAWAGRANVVANILKIPGQTPNIHLGVFHATPLIYAASSGHVDVVDTLLKAGAEVDAVTVDGATALIESVRRDRLAVVQRLLAAGANVEISSLGKTALTLALLNRKVEILEALIKHPATNINEPIFGRLSLLYLAIYFLPASIVNLLLERGANTNVPSSDRRSFPLHLAVELREHDYVQPLLDHGADQGLQDLFNRTAIDTVELDDKAFPMLNADFRTSHSDQIAKSESIIAEQALMVSIKPKGDEGSRSKLVTMSKAFHILNAIEDERIALEQCIRWKTVGNERVMEQSVACVGCRSLDDIIGTMYTCTKCPDTVLCTDCYEGHWSSEKPCKECRHDAQAFFAVPSEGWKELDAKGFVRQDSKTGILVTFDEWLEEKSLI